MPGNGNGRNGSNGKSRAAPAGNGKPKRKGPKGDPYAGHRRPNGTLLPGHSGGPGRKKSSRGEVFNRVADATLTETVATDVWNRLVKAAKAGEPWAIREILDRSLGKADQKFTGEVGFTMAEAFSLLEGRDGR